MSPRGRSHPSLPAFDGETRRGLPEAARSFLDAMNRRFACKLYQNRPLPPELAAYILECGRLSPSSFGLEHWRFVAAAEPGIKDSLREACFDQEAVGTASLVVTILVRREAAYEPASRFVATRAERFPGGLPVFLADYKGYYDFLRETGRIVHWARAQAYIACANMMTGAAAAGIDSCAIEGFRESGVLASLGEAPESWAVSLLVVFGYAAEPRRERIREEMGSIAELR